MELGPAAQSSVSWCGGGGGGVERGRMAKGTTMTSGLGLVLGVALATISIAQAINKGEQVDSIYLEQ